MLVGPRINTYFIATSCDLFLTCRGKKFIKYYTVLYIIWQVMCRLPNVKNPYFGWWPLLQGWERSSLQSYAFGPTAPLPLSHCPGHPLIVPLNPTFICDMTLAHWTSSWSTYKPFAPYCRILYLNSQIHLPTADHAPVQSSPFLPSAESCT
jgi:hypothetical protein